MRKRGRQAGGILVRLQQSVLPDIARRVVSRRSIDGALDLLRLRLDTFPHGLYQPVDALPVRTAKRAAGTASRWGAMRPLVERLGVRTAVDIGANASYFSIALGSLGVTTLAVEEDDAACRTATLAVRRSALDNVGVLRLELRADTLALLPATDCTLFLSLWHHLVREHGVEGASALLAGVWERTRRVMFFDTGESEMPPEYGLPAMAPSPRDWLAAYLARTCPGSRIEHLGEHDAFDAAGKPCRRNLLAAVRDDY